MNTTQIEDTIRQVVTISTIGLVFYASYTMIRSILSNDYYTWLKPDEYDELQQVASRWAIERTLALLPPGTPFHVVKRVASGMQSRIYERYGISIEELGRSKEAEKPKVKRKEREVAPVKVRKTEKSMEDIIANLGSRLFNLLKDRPSLALSSDEELARSIRTWAETDYNVSIPEEQSIKIVEEVRKLL